MNDLRKKIEYRIVGSCLIVPGYIAVVSSYVSEVNFEDLDCKRIWIQLAGGQRETQALASTARQVSAKIILEGQTFLNLLESCLALVEFCFRTQAVKILQTNRDKVLRPLGPIEKDVQNPENDVWQIVTAAANYCSDCEMPDLADQLTQLLTMMDQKARSLKNKKVIRHHVDSLKQLAVFCPSDIKEFITDLKEITNGATAR
jgi:hypothetical protein